MRGGHVVHVVDFAVGSPPPVERYAVPGSHALFHVKPGGGWLSLHGRRRSGRSGRSRRSGSGRTGSRVRLPSRNLRGSLRLIGVVRAARRENHAQCPGEPKTWRPAQPPAARAAQGFGSILCGFEPAQALSLSICLPMFFCMIEANIIERTHLDSRKDTHCPFRRVSA